MFTRIHLHLSLFMQAMSVSHRAFLLFSQSKLGHKTRPDCALCLGKNLNGRKGHRIKTLSKTPGNGQRSGRTGLLRSKPFLQIMFSISAPPSTTSSFFLLRGVLFFLGDSSSGTSAPVPVSALLLRFRARVFGFSAASAPLASP